MADLLAIECGQKSLIVCKIGRYMVECCKKSNTAFIIIIKTDGLLRLWLG